MSLMVGENGYWPKWLTWGEATPPQNSASRGLCEAKKRYVGDHAAAYAAWTGRLAWWDHKVPQLALNPGPASVGWHRESGVGGFHNRRWRKFKKTLDQGCAPVR